MHVPQTEEARAEAEILMRVQETFSRPDSAVPSLAAYTTCDRLILLTHGRKPIDRRGVMELLKKFNISELPAPRRGRRPALLDGK